MAGVNKDTLLAFFVYRLGMLKDVPQDGKEEYVKTAIMMGLADFWTAEAWSWTSRPYTLTVTAETESYQLPDDCRAIRLVRQTTSMHGSTIDYCPLGNFDHMCSKVTATPSGTPRIWTAYYDSLEKLRYLKFYPIPQIGTVIPFEIIRTTPESVEEVDGDYISGLYSAIERHIYPLGTNERSSAEILYQTNLKQLRRRDNVWADGYIHFFTPSEDIRNLGGFPWA